MRRGSRQLPVAPEVASIFVAHKLLQISLNAIPLLPAFLDPRAHSSQRVYDSPLSTKSTGDNLWIIGPKCNELTADRFRHFKLRGRTTNKQNKPTCRGIQKMPAATIITKNVQRLELRGLHTGTDRSTAAFLPEHGKGDESKSSQDSRQVSSSGYTHCLQVRESSFLQAGLWTTSTIWMRVTFITTAPRLYSHRHCIKPNDLWNVPEHYHGGSHSVQRFISTT
jgi:hypothetical protein